MRFGGSEGRRPLFLLAFARALLRAVAPGGFLPPEQRQKLPLAGAKMRIKPAAKGQFRPMSATRKSNAVRRHRGRCGNQMKIRMTGEKRVHIRLVFLHRKGTGGVQQHPAGAGQTRGVFEDLFLPRGAKRHVFGRPLLRCHLVFAEHPLAGARRVRRHKIKVRTVKIRQRAGVKVGHHRVGKPQPFHVPLQNSASCGHIFVCHQHAALPDGGGNLRGFSAGRGTKVDRADSGFQRHRGNRADGGRVLHIKHPRVVGGQCPHLIRPRQKRAGQKRQRLGGKGQERQERFFVGFHGVNPQRPHRRLFQRLVKSGKIQPRQGAHTGKKRFRNHHFPPSYLCGTAAKNGQIQSVYPACRDLSIRFLKKPLTSAAARAIIIEQFGKPCVRICRNGGIGRRPGLKIP